MFDPTAFDNMKVVIEGAIYDQDLDGEITIIDRNDLMNMAKLERSYEVTFAKKENLSIQCTFHLSARLENLAAELQPSSPENPLIGAHLYIRFNFEHADNQVIHEKIENELRNIWGKNRTISQLISYHPLEETDLIKKEIIIRFNRLILEEQMDDLVLMLEYILVSIEKLEHILN